MTDPAADHPADPAVRADAASRTSVTWRDTWILSLAGGLAVLMVLAGLALAFGWPRVLHALDVRGLFR